MRWGDFFVLESRNGLDALANHLVVGENIAEESVFYVELKI
jgi:hypothetical protein